MSGTALGTDDLEQVASPTTGTPEDLGRIEKRIDLYLAQVREQIHIMLP